MTLFPTLIKVETICASTYLCITQKKGLYDAIVAQSEFETLRNHQRTERSTSKHRERDRAEYLQTETLSRRTSNSAGVEMGQPTHPNHPSRPDAGHTWRLIPVKGRGGGVHVRAPSVENWTMLHIHDAFAKLIYLSEYPMYTFLHQSVVESLMHAFRKACKYVCAYAEGIASRVK